MRYPYTHDSEPPPFNPQYWREDPPTDKQIKYLKSWGVWRPNLTKGEACDLISQIKEKTDHMEWKDIRRQQELIKEGKAKPPIPIEGSNSDNPVL